MGLTDVQLSRTVSHALRHAPWLYELELDERGWVSVDQLILALGEKGGDWTSVDRASVERMIATATKRRYEYDGDRIRALYGHSLPGRIHQRPTSPPDRLYHGTAPERWAVIKVDGLRPMGRQFVHLSVDQETARSVGRRRSPRPVILTVDARGAASSGTAFYEGNDLVWLADSMPPEFIDVVDRL